MTERPTISACVAVYNGEEHIAKALRSIKDQTVQPDEILVVDDGSNDRSAEIAASFDGVRVIKQENGGIGSARAALVREAKGDWIAFCDHDDWWERERIEAELPLIANDVVLIYSGVWHVDEDEVETEYPLHTAPDAPTIKHLVPHPEDIWTSSTLIRRQEMLNVGNFDPSYRSGEDMLMWFQLGTRGRIVQVPRRLVHMTRRQGSTSAPNIKLFESAVRLYEESVLPKFDKWYASIDESDRTGYKRELEEKLGYSMSILANYYDKAGRRKEALRLHRQASKLNPKSKGVWYRFARSLVGAPGKPPI